MIHCGVVIGFVFFIAIILNKGPGELATGSAAADAVSNVIAWLTVAVPV